jgi:hypothetical protein
MNAMFAVVLLAACAAAQTFDFDRTTDLNKYLLKSRFNNYNKYDLEQPSSIVDLLRTTGLFGKHYNLNTYGSDRLATPWVLPKSYYGSQYNRVDESSIYTLDEIVRHPLFQQYLTLPLFRKHLTHPLFQYFLTTPLFQHYWTVPQFQTFFQNPYLFYKYIYPVIYNTESTIFDQVKVDPSYPYSGVDVDNSYVNQGVYDRDVLSKYLVPRHHQRSTVFDSLINRYPSIYGQQYSSIYRHHLPYSYVMDKIFKSYFVNKPQITEVVTDVKVLPDNKIDEQTYGKYVDPITGEIKYTNEDFKVVDEKINPFIGERSHSNIVDELLNIRKPTTSVFDELTREQYPHKFTNVKDALLKRLYLNKMMYGDRKMDTVFPEYTTVEDTKIPLLEKIEKLNKLNRFENVFEGKFAGGVEYPTTVDSELRLTKDLLTRVPLTKDIKDFTMSKYELPEFKTLDKPYKNIMEKNIIV